MLVITIRIIIIVIIIMTSSIISVIVLSPSGELGAPRARPHGGGLTTYCLLLAIYY